MSAGQEISKDVPSIPSPWECIKKFGDKKHETHRWEVNHE